MVFSTNRAILLVVMALFIMSSICAHAAPLKYKWVYASANMLVDDGVKKVQDVMKQAKAAGCNGIMLADSKFEILDMMDERYFRNVDKVKATAKELGIDIYPAVCSIGYTEGILAHDPNLIEGMPVKDAVFQVRGDQADVIQYPETRIVNGDFEQADGDRFTGWGFQDGIGKSSFIDKSVFHSGSASIRFENIGVADPENGLGRINQVVKMQPYRQYHISVWIKTEDFDTPAGVNILALGDKGRTLLYPGLQIQPTQDWTQYHVIFNSLDNSNVGIYLGVWGGKGGKIWWDDLQLEEVGLLNVIRRDGCPLTVKGEDGTVYKEGVDFETIKDERMGTVPWNGVYEIYHKPPTIRLTQNSKIRDGQKLRVSFHHAISVYGGQVVCCLTHPRVYSIIEDQIRRMNDLFQPKGFMMSHDEIRIANWCDLCQGQNVTPGKLLSDNVSRCAAIIRKVNPKATIFTWSDMFDPFHNARDNYYLVNGTFDKSWEGLPRDVVILNWNDTGVVKKSMDFFAKRGNPQILAGYYDGNPDRIRGWLDESKGIKGINGVMYTTWQNRYDDLSAFAKAAWGTKP